MRALISLACLTVCAAVAASPALPASSRALCGSERWSIKTLKDRPHLLPVHTTTIRHLVTRRHPARVGSRRLPFEHHVFRVIAEVTLFRPEDDGDIHVILRDPKGLQMIAETPSPGCAAGATMPQKIAMVKARRAVERCERPEGAPPVRAIVTGVAFFDYKHGQTGVAPNAIELHPILAFRCGR